MTEELIELLRQQVSRLEGQLSLEREENQRLRDELCRINPCDSRMVKCSVGVRFE